MSPGNEWLKPVQRQGDVEDAAIGEPGDRDERGIRAGWSSNIYLGVRAGEDRDRGGVGKGPPDSRAKRTRRLRVRRRSLVLALALRLALALVLAVLLVLTGLVPVPGFVAVPPVGAAVVIIVGRGLQGGLKQGRERQAKRHAGRQPQQPTAGADRGERLGETVNSSGVHGHPASGIPGCAQPRA